MEKKLEISIKTSTPTLKYPDPKVEIFLSGLDKKNNKKKHWIIHFCSQSFLVKQHQLGFLKLGQGLGDGAKQGTKTSQIPV